jgi:hypothetical protein
MIRAISPYFADDGRANQIEGTQEGMLLPSGISRSEVSDGDRPE